MRIITWNIGEDERKEDGRLDLNSYDYIVDVINKEKVDVICMQEAIIKSDYLPSIAEYIKENTDLKYYEEYELSDSHINIGCRMGVVICSKYEISNVQKVLFDNPNLVYEISETTTFYSHDKGFISMYIEGIKVVCGHCLPFHVFKKDSKDYLDVFKKMDEKIMDFYNDNNKMILCGDFNYQDAKILFENAMNVCNEIIEMPTKNNKQSDHLAISKLLECKTAKVLDNIFDHKLILGEILVK